MSSTYLYRTAREFGPDDYADDIRGLPAGHFVIIAGYDHRRRTVLVMDPYQLNPYSQVGRILDQHRPRDLLPSCWVSSPTTPIC